MELGLLLDGNASANYTQGLSYANSNMHIPREEQNAARLGGTRETRTASGATDAMERGRIASIGDTASLMMDLPPDDGFDTGADLFLSTDAEGPW